MNITATIKMLIPFKVKHALRGLVDDITFVSHARQRRQQMDQLEIQTLMLQQCLERTEARLLDSNRKSSELEFARGTFESIKYDDNRLTLSGFMMFPVKQLDTVRLYVNEEKVAESPIARRQHLAKAFPSIFLAEYSAFSFSIQQSKTAMEGFVAIRVVGVSNGREVAKFETWYRMDLESCLPVPPANLMLRETGCQIPLIYLVLGLQSYREFWTAACRHKEPVSITSMLDWGCGCGRVTGFFSKYSEIPRVCGCDIDSEAVTWSRRNLSPAEFSVIPAYPPTPYSNNEFDLIVSFSVLTHLSKNDQLIWLREIRRILSPGGLFLATIQGDSAAMFTFPGKKVRDILKNGIYDELTDSALDGVAPHGYYRSVFQSKSYTLNTYGQHFDILEYREQGGNGHQDLIVMRKKA